GEAFGIGVAVLDPSPATRVGIAALLGLETRPYRIRATSSQVAVVGPFAGCATARWERVVVALSRAVPTVCWLHPDSLQARRATALGAAAVLPDDGATGSRRLLEVVATLVDDDLVHPLPPPAEDTPGGVAAD